MSFDEEPEQYTGVIGILEVDFPDGYLIKIGDYLYFIPTDNKSMAAESLIVAGPNRRSVVVSAMESAVLVDSEKLLSYLENVSSIEEIWDTLTRNEPVKASPTDPASYGGFQQLKKQKFAALVCFEGADARVMALAYGKHIQSNERVILPPLDFAVKSGLSAKLCCVELHDCQKHPLKG